MLFNKVDLYRADSIWEDFPGFYVAALLQDTEPLNKYDQLYKLCLIASAFEAEPSGHLLAHVTKLTPLLICNCPQPSEIQPWALGEKRKAMHALCIPILHSCPHSWSPCVCYSTRSGFQGFCFRCNNLILVGWPGRWKQQTAQNGLSLLVSLAKGLCPSCLHLQQTASPVHVCRILLGHLCPLRSERCLCTDLQDLLASLLNKKNTCCPLDNTRGVSCQFPLYCLIQVGKKLSAQLQLHMILLKTRWKLNHWESTLQSGQRQLRALWGEKNSCA